MGSILKYLSGGFFISIYYLSTTEKNPQPTAGDFFLRVDGIEPSATCLKGRCSTTELHPQNNPGKIPIRKNSKKQAQNLFQID
jgi:hypothetical protein